MRIEIILIIAILLLGSCTVKKQPVTVEPTVKKQIDKSLTALIIDAKRQQLYDMPDMSNQILKNVITADSTADVAHYELARNFYEMRDIKNAIHHAKTAYGLVPDNFWYALLLADLYDFDNNFKESYQLYQHIIKKWDDKVEIWSIFWIFLEKNRKYDLLNKSLEEYEKKFGYTDEIFILRYQVYIREGKIKKAEEYLLKNISKNNNNIVPYLILGDLYFETNKIPKASEIYDKALKIDKNNPDALLGKVKIYLKQKEYNQAFNILEMLFLNPDVNVETKIGIFLSLVGEAEVNRYISEKRLNELIVNLYNQYDTNPEIRYFHGNLMYQEKKYKEAVDDFTFALNENPNNLQLWLFTLYLLSEINDNERIVTVADSAIMYFPSQKELFLQRGFAYHQLGNYQKSLDDFNFALKLTGNIDKDRNHILHFVSEVNYKLNNYDESFRIYDEILKNDNNDIVALNNYAYYLSVKNRNLEKALEMSLKTIKEEPLNSTYLDTYAYILFKMGKYSEALKYIELAIKYGGVKSSVILEHYGDILYMNNQIDFAVSTWQEAKIVREEKKDYDDDENGNLLNKKIELRQYLNE